MSNSRKIKPGMRFNPYKMFTGSLVPNAIMRRKDLTSTQKLLWARLSQYSGNNGQVYPALETLARELGISKSQVRRDLRIMEDKGLIKRELRIGRSSKYHFLWHECFEEQEGGQQMNRGESTDNPSPGQHTDSKYNNEKKKKKKTRKTSTRQHRFLSEEEKRYIHIKTEYEFHQGKIRTRKGAYKNGLKTKALNGELKIHDFEKISQWYDLQEQQLREEIASKGNAINFNKYNSFDVSKISKKTVPRKGPKKVQLEETERLLSMN